MKKYILPSIIAIILFIVIGKGLWDNNRVHNQGVFIIGKLYKIAPGGKNLPTSHFYFYLKGERHEFSYRDGGVSDSLRMFKVLLSNPNKVVILDDAVPSCLEFKDVPAEGWTEMPVCGNVSQ